MQLRGVAMSENAEGAKVLATAQLVALMYLSISWSWVLNSVRLEFEDIEPE